MKSIIRFSRSIFVVLSFTLLVLSGCGGGSDSTPTATGTAFTASKVSGKTFAYTSASGSTGSLAFNADGTWHTTVASSAFSGTWSIDPVGKLVCVTTSGGNHTITYTLLDESARAMNVSAIEANPSDPANPASYTATLATAFTTDMLAGKTIAYSSATGSTGTIVFGHDGTWQTKTGTSVFTGTWSIKNGALECVTTSGGNHTITYTRTNTTDNPMAASASEVDPSAPGTPTIYTVTLKAVDILATASASDIFNFTVTFKNLPGSLPQTASTTPNYTVIPYRRQWAFFIPLFNGPNGILVDEGSGSDDYRADTSNPSSMYGVHLYPNGIPNGTPAAGPLSPILPTASTTKYNSNPIAGNIATFGFKYGFTVLEGTSDNFFYFKVTYPTATGSGQFTTPLLGFMIWSTPANSSWVYDYATNKMTQTP